MESLIYDEDQVFKFVEILERYNDNNKIPLDFYLQIHARKKHGSPVETILARKVISIKSNLAHEVNKLTPFCGFIYIDRKNNGETVTETETAIKIDNSFISVYITPEARNTYKANTELACEFSVFLTNKYLDNEHHSDNKNFNLISKYYNHIQKNPLSKKFLDIDIDRKDFYPLIVSFLKELKIDSQNFLVPLMSSKGLKNNSQNSI